jgi:transposase-like protein/ribosomal protein L24E
MKRKQLKSKMQRYTVRDFEKQFPNDDACLDWLKDFLYPDGIHCETCQKITPHYKVASRKSYSCQFCGHHVHPTAGTIYHKSSTPLRLWFKAVFLMSSTRCGIAAKQLERELGVTYKTAWRMFHQIRSMLSEDGLKLSGKVEVDETYVGGRKKGGKTGFGAKEHKSVVAGALERDSSVIAKVVPDVKGKTLIPFISDNVSKEATIYSDELHSYDFLYRHCAKHERINHGRKQWVNGDIHTNSIEGFWSLLKGGIRGVYKHVGRDYMQNYVNEYAFRYNRRHSVNPMFLSFLTQVQKLSD